MKGTISKGWLSLAYISSACVGTGIFFTSAAIWGLQSITPKTLMTLLFLSELLSATFGGLLTRAVINRHYQQQEAK